MNLELDKICIGLIVISMLLSGCTAEGPVDPKQGCTDKLASNFDINAELDNGECEYAGARKQQKLTVALKESNRNCQPMGDLIYPLSSSFAFPCQC